MTKDQYALVTDWLTKNRKQVSNGKREDYTKGSKDVLANFKNAAQALGLDPKVALAVHMEKQFSAVMNYIKTNGQSESEPIIERIGDTINYLELLWGLIQEEEQLTDPYFEMTVNGRPSETNIDYDGPYKMTDYSYGPPTTQFTDSDPDFRGVTIEGPFSVEAGYNMTFRLPDDTVIDCGKE